MTKMAEISAHIIVATFLAIVCSSCTPFPDPSTPESAVSALHYRQGDNPLAPNRRGGIFKVDGQFVSSSDNAPIRLHPGSHRIAYLCPGWRYVDGYPEVKHRFERGIQYELSCANGEVHIE
ncbi:hypothetical protein [Nevskia sp.]|uniref:hypothetical protein n=1 Tax=Nevskia sp. TaxID=1929292 RepID=UPI0025E19701|nr:hypothetical protein [Nevskia sp.]